MTFYKVLVNGRSCHGGDLQWSLPVHEPDGMWTPGQWHEVSGDVAMCERGLHLTTEPFNWYKWDCACYDAEADQIVSSQDGPQKTVCRRARLLREVPHPEWWLETHRFVASLKEISWFAPTEPPLKSWKHFETRAAAQTAARAAAWDAAQTAAWDAAQAAARAAARAAAQTAAGAAAGDAAWAAAGDAAGAAAQAAARAAARAAAWAAAGAAAGDAAWAAAGAAAQAAARAAAQTAAQTAAGAAAWDAAVDAELMARVIVAELKGTYRDHAEARMDVWRRGYGLLCDVDGVLYTYSKV